MNGDFIFNPWWLLFGSFFLTAIFFICFHNYNKNLEDVIDDEPEEATTYNRYEARITTAVK